MLFSVDVSMERVFPFCKLVPLYYVRSTFLPALLAVPLADADYMPIFHVNKDFYLFFGKHRGQSFTFGFMGTFTVSRLNTGIAIQRQQ